VCPPIGHGPLSHPCHLLHRRHLLELHRRLHLPVGAPESHRRRHVRMPLAPCRAWAAGRHACPCQEWAAGHLLACPCQAWAAGHLLACPCRAWAAGHRLACKCQSSTRRMDLQAVVGQLHEPVSTRRHRRRLALRPHLRPEASPGHLREGCRVSAPPGVRAPPQRRQRRQRRQRAQQRHRRPRPSRSPSLRAAGRRA